MDLDLCVRRRPGAVILVLAGELDLSGKDVVEGALRKLERDGRTSTIVLDLQNLTFLDCTGLGCFVAAHRRLQASGRRLRIVPSHSRVVQRIFDLTGMDSYLELAEVHRREKMPSESRRGREPEESREAGRAHVPNPKLISMP